MERKQKLTLWTLGLAALSIIVYLLTKSIDTSGVIMAFAMVGIPIGSTPTTTTTDTYAPGLNREDISKSVTEMLPSRTPLDTIMRNIKHRTSAKSQKIGYYQASYKPVKDSLDSSVTGNGSSGSSPASSYSYSSSEITSIFVQVLNPDIWRACDTILMRELTLPGTKSVSRVGDASTHKDDVMFYVAKKDGYVLELVPVNGVKGSISGQNSNKFIVPDFISSVELIRMGQAKSELAISTEPFALYPHLSWQYCQNFMAQIEESTFQRLTEKEVNWGFTNFEAVNILSMKMEMELSMLFGQGGEYQIGNDHTYFTRGITRDIENVLEYGTSSSGDRTITKAQYNSWLKEVFDGNNGSASRLLFAGSGLIKSLSQVDDFYKGIGTITKDLTLGVDVRRIDTYFGTLDIVLAPLFKEAGWEDHGIILDLEHVTKHEFVPLSVTELDLKKSGQKNADARVIQEVSALTLRYPDCHAIIKPKA